MKTPLPLAILFFGTVLIGCSDKKAVVESATPEAHAPNGNASGQTMQFGGNAEADSLFFQMERTPCFGQCKAYRINIYRSGYATFEGRSNVEREGMHRGFVGKDTLETLLRGAEKIQFFQLEDKYDGPVTDLPSSIIRIVSGDRDKRVQARVGTPEEFRAYFDRAEGLLFPLAWRPLPAAE